MLDVTALGEHLEYDLNFAEMDEQKCYELLRYASAAAALVTVSYGAICVMPEKKDIFTLALINMSGIAILLQIPSAHNTQFSL